MRRAAGLLLVVLVGCGVDLRNALRPPATTIPVTGVPESPTTTEFVGPASVGGAFPAVRELAHPRVAERDPARPPYVREDWDGRGWADDDGNGCNTRAEVLRAESLAPTISRPGSCTVFSGLWTDRYTGQTFTDAASVQVDHLVALGDAAASGGWRWSAARKAAFTNDLDDAWSLNAVSGAENQRKADSGPDRWLPPAVAFRCTYVAAYSGIKARWGLTVTPAQWVAIEKVWASC